MPAAPNRERGRISAPEGGRGPGTGAVVADDLTGAMDGGVQLLPRTAVEVLVSAAGAVPSAPVDGGVQTLARGGPTPPAGGDRVPDASARTAQAEDASVLPVINTQSRGVPPDEAAARVRATCRELSAAGRTVWFKKIDSTLRGNVGAELAALHAALAPCVIVCTPALPEQGRTVQDGVLLVAGEPAMATPYPRRDSRRARHRRRQLGGDRHRAPPVAGVPRRASARTPVPPADRRSGARRGRPGGGRCCRRPRSECACGRGRRCRSRGAQAGVGGRRRAAARPCAGRRTRARCRAAYRQRRSPR